jgi:putative glutamine amidotransferase
MPVARRPPGGLPKLGAVTRLVAVSATRRTDAGRERVALNTAYVYALMRAGLVPLLVPPILDPEAACAALDGVHGLVLTGGEDVEPSRYGATPHPKLGETDRARDAVELALIAGAERRRLPVLAICRGIQILNVALGGTLYQDLASERPGPVDHADARSRHRMRVDSGTLLHRTLGAGTGAGDASVNSRHHQAIRDVAPALRANAWAEDGVIEGAERKDPGAPWTLAVQWHPEEDVEDALFRGFAAAIA